MSGEITVYAFEKEGDESATDWTTQDYIEAREYAQANGYSLIGRTYEYTDSELIEDYRPGHNLDGTPVEPEPDETPYGIVFQGKRYRQPFGIPYAREGGTGKNSYAECPRCGEHVTLARLKDFESHDGSEYSQHYFAQHAEADGMIRLAGVWYEAV